MEHTEIVPRGSIQITSPDDLVYALNLLMPQTDTYKQQDKRIDDQKSRIDIQAQEILKLQKENEDLLKGRSADREEINQIKKDREVLKKEVNKLNDLVDSVATAAVGTVGVGLVIGASLVNPFLGLGVRLAEMCELTVVAQEQDEKRFLNLRIELAKQLMPSASLEQIKCLCKRIDEIAFTHVEGLGDNEGYVYYDYKLAFSMLCKGKEKSTQIPGFNEEVLKAITSMPTHRRTARKPTFESRPHGI